ncbi:MAG: sporulation protein [Alishewanella agri]|nr:sporulation protein [Alishewanella agri]
MKIRGLQQQLAANTYLLPSQREVLTRLLFQLAFNDFSHLALIGAEGSGKSTIALVLAELLSDCQEMPVNVALVSLPAAGAELRQQLSQHWFATSSLNAADLLSRIKAQPEAEFVLLLDNADLLQADDWQWLQQLPVRIFSFCQQPTDRMQLNLSIPALTLTDCQQLLQAERLDAISLAERFAHCQGNLHRLLQPEIRSSTKPLASEKAKRGFPWPLALLTAVFASVAAFIWMLPTATEPPLVTLPTTIPAQQTEPPTTPVYLMPASEVVDAEAIKIKSASPAETSAAITEPDATTPESVAVSGDELPNSEQQNHAQQNHEQQKVADSTLAAIEQPAAATVSGTAATKTSAAIDAGAGAKVIPTIRTEVEETAVVTGKDPILNWAASQRLVQLAVLSEPAAVLRFKRDFPTVEHLVYQRRWQGREQWVIVAGPFDNNSLALQYIERLPARLKTSGPFSKTVRSVQQEILAWQRSVPVVTEQEN